MTQHVWIDDKRDPKCSLPAAVSESVVWIKSIHEALEYVQKNAADIEVLYLDYYMDSSVLFGSEFVMLVQRFGHSKFPQLKTVYLHSDAKDKVKALMKYAPKLKSEGIDLKIATYRK